VRTAVAYPGAARGRTGLTIAMFSLIIFSLVMMSTMNHNYMESALGDEANAGWDVRADAITSEPPADFSALLEAQGVDTGQFAALGLVTNPSEYSSNLRLSGADEWKTWPVQGVDRNFLEYSGLLFSQRAEGYASDSDIVQALLDEPNVAVIDANAVPGEGDIGRDKRLLELTGLKASDETFEPITVELQSSIDGHPYAVTIIGIIDSQIGSLSGMFASQETVDAVYPAPVKASWYVAIEDSAKSDQVAKEIESALLQSGVQVSSIRDELRDMQRQEGGFLMIIQGFMGLGLFVGVAAVGVIAFRSVVERRQQIGVLRALGFQRELVSLSFMIETLFVVGLGVLTGTGLGLRLAQNLVQDPDQGFSQDVSFIIPWTTILPIITLTIVVALVMTWIPARQAGKIAPAEALRYE
jgi:putative ABC transport system permease protein